MATIRNNALTEGLRGMIGDQLVFRQLRGKTIVSASPSPSGKQSELQRENRLRFRKASTYAKRAMKDPEKKKYYWHKAKKQGLPNAYTAALTDYMRKPVIKQITIAKRKDGGHVVRIGATKKDFALTAVEVKIKNEQGIILESGTATRKEALGDWHYKPALALTNDLQIEVVAIDRMENRTREKVQITGDEKSSLVIRNLGAVVLV